MSGKYIFTTKVSYGEVDRDERLLLSCVFKILQEAAIRHANAFDTGSRSAVDRGETWVLNRSAVRIETYPHYEDVLRVETWSRGINGFRGHREYRIFHRDQLLVSASALWLYVSLATKSLVRVPPDVIENFPAIDEGPFFPELERFRIEMPDQPPAVSSEVSLRYSDIDANEHVNNTAYLDFLQTALARAGLTVKPRALQIRFLKEIPAGATGVMVDLTALPSAVVFCIRSNDTTFAVGCCES